MRAPSGLTYSSCPSTTPNGRMPGRSSIVVSPDLSEATPIRAPARPFLGQLTYRIVLPSASTKGHRCCTSPEAVSSFVSGRGVPPDAGTVDRLCDLPYEPSTMTFPTPQDAPFTTPVGIVAINMPGPPSTGT